MLVGRWVLESYVRKGPFQIFEYQRRTWKIPAARKQKTSQTHPSSFSFLAIFSLPYLLKLLAIALNAKYLNQNIHKKKKTMFDGGSGAGTSESSSSPPAGCSLSEANSNPFRPRPARLDSSSTSDVNMDGALVVFTWGECIYVYGKECALGAFPCLFQSTEILRKDFFLFDGYLLLSLFCLFHDSSTPTSNQIIKS